MQKTGELRVVLDTEIEEILKKVFSSCLPHDNFESSLVVEMLRDLKNVISLDETYGEYYVMYQYFLNALRIRAVKRDFKIRVTRDLFDTALTIGIDDLIRNEKIRVENMLEEEGFENNLAIEDTYNKAVDLLYTRCMQLYDECVEMAIPTSEGYMYLETLHQFVIENLSKQMVRNQSIILNEGLSVGRTVYKGVMDLYDYISYSSKVVEIRKKDFLGGRNMSSLTDIDASQEFDESTEGTVSPLFKLGIKPYDEFITVSTGDLITWIGDEGVGKTNTMVYQTVEAMMKGHDVLYMVGESSQRKIRNMVLSRYIHKNYNKKITWKELESGNLPENMLVLAAKCKKEMVERKEIGKLHLIDKFTYEEFESEVRDIVEKHTNIRLIIIDHIDRLTSNSKAYTERGFLRSQKERIDYLYFKAVDLKRNYPLAFMFVAHTSVDAYQQSSKGKNVGVRIGATSAATTKDSDMVFHLTNPVELSRQGFIKCDSKKLRDYKGVYRSIILKQDFSCSNLVYDEDFQHKAGSDDELEELY